MIVEIGNSRNDRKIYNQRIELRSWCTHYINVEGI